jgi:predicted transcriptional regulator
MEVRLNPELEAKLARIAAESGHGAETLIEEAIERFVDYDEWFSRQVEEGLNAAADGRFIEHGEVRNLIDSRYPG